jgi:hypothetical protein
MIYQNIGSNAVADAGRSFRQSVGVDPQHWDLCHTPYFSSRLDEGSLSRAIAQTDSGKMRYRWRPASVWPAQNPLAFALKITNM